MVLPLTNDNYGWMDEFVSMSRAVSMKCCFVPGIIPPLSHFSLMHRRVEKQILRYAQDDTREVFSLT